MKKLLLARAFSVVVCVVVFGMGTMAKAADEFRTWTDSTGKFKIKAKYVSLDGDKLTLEKDDGTELEMSLKKLSKVDQKEAQRLAEDSENPFKPKTENPFDTAKKKPGETAPKMESKTPSSGTKAAKGKGSVKGEVEDDVESVSAPMSASETITPVSSNDEWKLDVVELPDDAKFLSKPKSTTIPPKLFFEGLEKVVVNVKANKAAIGYFINEPKDEGRSRIVVCDLSTGKAVNGAPIPGHYRPLAISDDGKQILMHKVALGWGKGDDHFCELWTMTGPKEIKRKLWMPFSGEAHGGEIYWGQFLGNDRFVLSSRSGAIGFWKVEDLEPLFHLTTVDGAIPALSPDHSRLAFSDGDRVAVLDIEKREVVASVGAPQKLQWPVVAFSPTGSQIGCVAFNRLLIWETESGKLVGEMEANVVVNGACVFPSENLLLAGKHFLFDVSQQLQLWKFDGHQEVCSAGGWTFFATNEIDAKKPGLLTAIPLPHPALKDLRERALKDPTLFILREGVTVKLDLNGISDMSQRPTVAAALTKQLEKNGCKVADEGTITLVAAMEGPKEREMRYHRAGTYKVQEWKDSLKFVYSGTVVWQAGGTNVPFVLRIEAGENIGTALKKHEKPNYEWFGHQSLPRFLQKPKAQGAQQAGFGLGSSQLTSSGIK